MAAISQIISTLPDAPNRGVDTQTVFVTKAEAMFDALSDEVTELNTFGSQANSLRTEVNTARDTVVAKEALVSPHYTAIDTVSSISSNVTTVASNTTNINTVAGISSNVTTVATNISNVNTNATNITSINTNATNIVAIQNASSNATSAANSAASAAASANVTKWISGTTYTQGANVWSPIDYQTYRRKTNGAGTTDPSSDSTNWEAITVGNAVMEW